MIISEMAHSQGSASAWRITEDIKCYMQTIFIVWMCEYQKACALESRYYSLFATAFSRFL